MSSLSTAPRYATRAGIVTSIDRLDAETLLTVRVAGNLRLLTPAGGFAWAVGQAVEILVETTTPARAVGLAARIPGGGEFRRPRWA